MNKTETLKQLAEAANRARLNQFSEQIETLSSARQQGAQDLAALIEPMAQAMAALTEETRKTLSMIETSSKEHLNHFQQQMNSTAGKWDQAVKQTVCAANQMDQMRHSLEWTHYALAVAMGLLTAVLVSGFWLWLAPPSVINQLDARQVAQYLKPAVIEALRRSKNK